MLSVQAVIFKKDKYTKNKVDVWLRRHNYKRIKPIHETLNYFRARIKEPNSDLYDYRIIKFNNDIKAVVEFKKI